MPWRADLGDGTYRNPVLNADWSDPDAIRVGSDYYLIASSFNRVPGLPVLHSRDLVNWSIIGHALDELVPRDHYRVPRHGCGVWAPALRHYDGRFWIYYPDPDYGIFVVTADDPAGPWSKPVPVIEGRGLIDPCPLWDDDGQGYVVLAWAKSRAGFNNVLTLYRMTADSAGVADEGHVIVNGDEIPGCRTLEGPKVYRHDGWYWIFAPAGGVAEGWQYAFRSRQIDGPYEHRVVLEQGETPVNGPHQGAWVDTVSGEDWFLHFQDRGPHGRVVHLQPMEWRDDGWPVMGTDGGDGRGTPVTQHAKPAVPSLGEAPTPQGDELAGPSLHPQWAWQANPDSSWWSFTPAGLRLACLPGPADLRHRPNVLVRRLPGVACTAAMTVRLDSTASGTAVGLGVLGDAYAWVGLHRTDAGPVLVDRRAGHGESEREATAPALAPTAVSLAVDVDDDAVCQFRVDLGDGWKPIGTPFPARAGRWVGATLAVFAAAPYAASAPAGHADINGFSLSPEALAR